MSERMRAIGIGRRLRRRLGLPDLSPRAWLLAVVVLLGFVYAGVTLVADFVETVGGYGPEHYEPKDFTREEWLEKRPDGRR